MASDDVFVLWIAVKTDADRKNGTGIADKNNGKDTDYFIINRNFLATNWDNPISFINLDIDGIPVVFVEVVLKAGVVYNFKGVSGMV